MDGLPDRAGVSRRNQDGSSRERGRGGLREKKKMAGWLQVGAGVFSVFSLFSPRLIGRNRFVHGAPVFCFRAAGGGRRSRWVDDIKSPQLCGSWLGWLGSYQVVAAGGIVLNRCGVVCVSPSESCDITERAVSGRDLLSPSVRKAGGYGVDVGISIRSCKWQVVEYNAETIKIACYGQDGVDSSPV